MYFLFEEELTTPHISVFKTEVSARLLESVSGLVNQFGVTGGTGEGVGGVFSNMVGMWKIVALSVSSGSHVRICVSVMSHVTGSTNSRMLRGAQHPAQHSLVCFFKTSVPTIITCDNAMTYRRITSTVGLARLQALSNLSIYLFCMWITALT
jgi:hypothetical protein